MTLMKLTDRIYALPSDEEGDRPVLGYIKGDKYSLMIDAGNSKEHYKLFKEGLKKYDLPLPTFVAITHWHWDHTFAIHDIDGIVIANILTNNQLEKVKTWEWTRKAMIERLKSGEEIKFCDVEIRREYKDLKDIKVELADVVFENNLTIDLGNLECKLTLIGGPHSEDSTIIYIPSEGIVFVGDADYEDYYHNDGKYDKGKLERYIEYIKGLDFHTYINGHDKIQTKKVAIKYLEEQLISL